MTCICCKEHVSMLGFQEMNAVVPIVLDLNVRPRSMLTR